MAGARSSFPRDVRMSPLPAATGHSGSHPSRRPVPPADRQLPHTAFVRRVVDGWPPCRRRSTRGKQTGQKSWSSPPRAQASGISGVVDVRPHLRRMSWRIRSASGVVENETGMDRIHRMTDSILRMPCILFMVRSRAERGNRTGMDRIHRRWFYPAHAVYSVHGSRRAERGNRQGWTGYTG